MKKTVTKWMGMLLCLVLAVSLLPAPISASSAQLTYFGYQTLKTDNQRYVYSQLLSCVSSVQASIDLDNNREITPDDIQIASEMFLSDHPECFWYCGAYSYSFDGQGYAVSIMPKYKINGAEVEAGSSDLTNQIKAFNKAVNDIVAAIPSSSNEYQKALYLHDKVAGLVSYQMVGDHQSAYGALIGKKAVCAGYARAYQILLQKAGISAWTISGTSKDPNGQTVEHAWNVLWLGGKCYYADVTWDDQGKNLFHSYFARSLTHFNRDHVPAEPYKSALSSCNHTDMDYFQKESGKNSGVIRLTASTTATQLANCCTEMKKTGDQGSRFIAIRAEGVDFSQWFNTHGQEFCKAAGFSSVKAEMTMLGDEIQVTFRGAVAQTEIPVERIILDTAEITLTKAGQTAKLNASVHPSNATDQRVTFSSSDSAVAKVDTNTGKITAIANGQTVITVQSVAYPDVRMTCRVVVNIAPIVESVIEVIDGKAMQEDGTPVTKAPAGTKIFLKADSAPVGMEFDRWEIRMGSVKLQDPNSEATYFTMGEEMVRLKAIYRTKPIAVTGVALDETAITLVGKGSGHVLNAVISPSNAADQRLIWSSSDPSVATVEKGVVTAVGPGTATITVCTQDGGFTATCRVTVQFHQHDAVLEYVPAVNPTCLNPGFGAYYICNSCGAWFADDGAVNQILDTQELVIPAKNHTPSEWQFDEDYHWKSCTDESCGVMIPSTEGAHQDADKNEICDVCGGDVFEEPDPTDPPKQTEPAKPTEPEKPTEPDHSTEPSAPTDVTDPTEPPSDTKPTDPDPVPGGAQEDTTWIIWVGISLGVGIAAIVAYLIIKRRNRT